MVDTFHKYIRGSISDEDLQIALDANAERRIEARENAFSSLSGDLQEYRQRAKNIRQDVIDNLDQYLEQFTRQAESNGIQIHVAATAEEAVQHVLNIAQATQCRLIAKSKTMVSEEIDLN
ncbi:MAG: lactate utilization protein, partial [Anaerolineales bacterium]|nr:lactate utilization protein [Anaerolineales bacterium]